MITAPEDGLAVRNFQIVDANLYFSSWAAFMFGLFILASVGNERGVNAARDTYAKRYIWLIVSSLVVVTAASRMFDQRCDTAQKEEHEYCKELKLGIGLGVTSAVICCIMALFVFFSPAIIPLDTVGLFMAMALIAIWATLVAYLTFENGPAKVVGNLFFGVWVSAILSIDLAVCYLLSFY